MTETNTTFLIKGWKDTCKNLADEAAKYCGQSHDFYMTRFSKEIDKKLQYIDEHHRDEAIKIAAEFDYLTEEQREEMSKSQKENGLCSHGIELDCCPLGCGSI